MNAHVSKEQQKEQLMKGWGFGILNSSGPAALLLNKRASASYLKIAKKKKKNNPAQIKIQIIISSSSKNLARALPRGLQEE